MTTLKELSALLDAATGPSQELDADLAEAFGFKVWWRQAVGTMEAFPVWDGPYGVEPCWKLSSSIDAALALVERLIPRAQYAIDTFSGPRASVNQLDENGDWSGRVCAAPTAPLAILRALVDALIAQEKDHE